MCIEVHKCLSISNTIVDLFNLEMSINSNNNKFATIFLNNVITKVKDDHRCVQEDYLVPITLALLKG
jgi:hypothetical protein